MFDVDVERLYQSKTWLIAPADVKPWLLRLWVESWRSIPVGSFEDDDELIAARIEMPGGMFQAHRKVLMRGWILHSDGLLYHPVITEMVLKIEGWRTKERERKEAWRARKMSRGTDVGQTGTDTSLTWERRSLTFLDDTSSSSSSSSSSNHPTDDSAKTPSVSARKPPPPYTEILALWAEILPELPRPHGVEHWTDARKAQIRARWNDQLPDLDSWRQLFVYIRQSPFLMGQTAPHPRSGKPFRLDLFWITKPENLLKVSEGKYHG